MITRGLGLTHLLAVGGPSMGSFQSLEWGINYPDFVTGLILIVPAARMDRHFAPVMDAFEAMIRLDPQYRDGKYTENPADGIRGAALIFFPWVLSDEYLTTLDEAAYQRAEDCYRRRMGKGMGRQQPPVALPRQQQLRCVEAFRRRYGQSAGPGEGQGAAAVLSDGSHRSGLSDAGALSRFEESNPCGDSVDPRSSGRRHAARYSGIYLCQ